MLEQYQAFLLDYLTKDVLNSGYNAIYLVHDNYQYSAKNKDYWYNLSEELKTKLSTSMALLSTRDTYILSLEDSKDE